MKRLPPLTGIEAFVQVARLGSVKAAAEALSLSSPALTRRVQTLERHVGRPLFDRRHQAIDLNPEGERLLAAIAPAVAELSLAMEQAAGRAELMRLRLGTMPLFASHRLIPGLAQLRALHPELHVDIDTGPFILSRLEDGLDAAVVLAREIDSGLYSRPLGTNRGVAIAARRLAEGPDAIRAPADLARHTILLHRDLPDAFEVWRAAVGLPELEPAAVDLFDSGQLILEAAALGSASPSCSTCICTRRATRGWSGSSPRPPAPTATGSPAAAPRWDGGRSGCSTTGWWESWRGRLSRRGTWAWGGNAPAPAGLAAR